MAKNKKHKRYNSNNSHRPQNQQALRRTVTVRERKKELVRERIHKDVQKSRGMRAVGIILIAIMLSRLALFVFELVFFGIAGKEVSVVSNLLIIPLLLIVYMVHDGNRGLMSVTAISAVVRVIYLFAAVYPSLDGVCGGTAFVTAYLTVMALQFILSVVGLSMSNIKAYCDTMREVNLELRSNIINSRRR